jgi:hypothetical protein
MPFPLTDPTRLTVTPGAHPTRSYRSIAGATNYRLLGSVPVNPRLQADFLCTTAEAASVVSDYHATFSGANATTIDDAFWTGHEELLAALPTRLDWHYTGEPRVEPILQGRVRLSVEFEGQLEA